MCGRVGYHRKVRLLAERAAVVLFGILLPQAACRAFGTEQGDAGDAAATVDGHAAISDAHAEDAGADAPPPVPCRSIQLDGTSSYLEVSGGGAPFENASFTLEAWVKINQSPDEMHIVAHSHHDQADGYLLLKFADKFQGRIYQKNSGTHERLDGDSVKYNKWQHVALVYDSAAGKMTVFVDGHGTSTSAPTVADKYSGPARIGAASYVNGFYLDGLIDEVRVTKGVAYASDFTPPYPLPDDDPNTVGVWHLSEGVGLNSAEARARTGMSLALHGAATWSSSCAKP